jgi:hypothetical protein
MVAINKGSLELDKIVGVRPDNGRKFSQVKVKPSDKLPEAVRSTKTVENTKQGWKKN